MPATIPVFAFLDVGGPEIMLILLVALLLFGSERLPELARNLGKSMREFKKATSGLEAELRRAMDTTTPPAPPHPAATPPPGVYDPEVPDDEVPEPSPASEQVVEDLKPSAPAQKAPEAPAGSPHSENAATAGAPQTTPSGTPGPSADPAKPAKTAG